MAIAFRAMTSVPPSNEFVTTFTINKPTGTVDNDFMLIGIGFQDTNAQSITAPGGWTNLVDRIGVNGSRPRFMIYYKKAASEGASYTFSWPTNMQYAAFCVSYSGVNTTSPLDASGSGSAGVSTTSATAGSVTAVASNAMLLSIVGCYGTLGGVSFTPPTGMTERADQSSGTTQANLSLAELQLSSSGSTGSRTFTASGNMTDGSYCTITLAQNYINQSVTGAIGTMSGTLSRVINKPLSGVFTGTGALFKRIPIHLDGVTGALSGAFSQIRAIPINLVGVMGSLSGSISRQINKALAGALSPIGILTRQGMPLRLSGATGDLTAALGTLKVRLVDLAGVLSPVGAITATFSKFHYAIMKAGSVVKKVFRGGSAT